MDPVEDDEFQHNLYLRVATENDETQSMINDKPMSLDEFEMMSSVPNLQISISLPPAQLGFQWHWEALESFGKLPQFSPEQAKDLISVFGSPLGRQPVSVRDYLKAFTGVPENRQELRRLTEHLKKIGRTDVVKAMHLQKGALCWLGPVLPEEMPLSDIAPSLWVPLTAALSAPHLKGFNWKWLAEKVEIQPLYIDLWQHKENPASEVLTSWRVRKSATIGRLFDLLLECREDLAAML